MDKKVFLEKLYQLRENIQKVITYRKERSSIDINPDSPDAGFTVNAIYLHKGIPNAYDVFYGSLNKQGFYLAELFDLKYGDENKYDMNFYQFHMDFFNQTVDVEKLQLAENSMDKLDVMLKFTDTLLGEDQPLDKELAIDALGILNSNFNTKLLSVGYRSTEDDVYIVPTNDLIHMEENMLLGITTSDRYIDKNMNQRVVNRLTHSISDENASYLITQSGAIETLWIEKQNRKTIKVAEPSSKEFDSEDTKKDRHGLDGQQDEFHELNLFTNDSIIGWKVPTNLGASSALTVPHQYLNYSINDNLYHLLNKKNYQFFERLETLYDSAEKFEEYFANKDWYFVIEDGESFQIEQVHVRDDQFGHLVGLRYTDNGSVSPQKDLYQDLINKKLDFHRTLVQESGGTIKKISMMRDFLADLNQKYIFLNDLNEFKSDVKLSKGVFRHKKNLFQGFRLIENKELRWITNMGFRNKKSKELLMLNHKQVIAMLTKDQENPLRIIALNGKITNASDKVLRAMDYIDRHEWQLKDQQQVAIIMEDLLKQKVNKTQTVQELILQHQIELNLTDIHGDDPSGLVTEFLRSARESGITKQEITHVNQLVNWAKDKSIFLANQQQKNVEDTWSKKRGDKRMMNPEVKSKLASSSPLVRRSVLARNDLTEEAIDRLANDWDVSVRALTATYKYRLDKLVHDSEDRVIMEVLQHMYGLDVIEQNFKLTEAEKEVAKQQMEVTPNLPSIEKLRVNANLVSDVGYHLEQQYQEDIPFVLVALAGQGYKLDELAQHENPMVSSFAKYHQNDLQRSLTGTGTKEEKLELIAKGKYRAYFLNDEDPDIRKALITSKAGYTAGYALDVLSQDADPSVAKLAKEKIIENQMYLLPENQIQNLELEKEQNQEPYYSVAPAMEEVEVTPNIDSGIQALVDNHELQQWKKNPDLYFVKGLKKVAIERQEDGSFKVSEKFAPTDDKAKQRVEEILSKQTGQTQEIKEPEKDFNPLDKENISQYALDLIKNYVADPQEMKDYLDFMSKFPNLSPRNVALIQKQWHGANAVATYNQWAEYHEKLGLTADDIEPSIRVYKNRKTGEEKTYTEAKLSVKAGEKAQITLFRPIFSDVIPTLDEKGNIKVDSKGSPVLKLKEYATEMEKQALKEGKIKVVGQRKTGFTTYKVFELSQTNLKPESYPKAMPNRHYNFDVDEEITKKMIEGLKDYSNEIGVPIKIDTANNLGNAHGAYYPTLEMILLNKNNTPTENIGTSIHELAHATLHNNKKVEASVAEFEAEMTSYIVAKSFGMDTGDKAVHYIAGWTKNLSLMDDKQLNESLSRVHKTAQKMIDTINKRMDPPINKAKEKANNQQQNMNPPLSFMSNSARSI
ncbi:ImmA/IrrE family metallo-endopeptidase [Enterococcus cecorum]|uniref:ImmA/IrrE family metallo-endopeptidase n=1 Tax=Enterococcus cecorum TaxID=44008 RepID=UPI0032677994